jgi:hypothetical protein
MILYHRTTPEAAEAILKDGFRNATSKYLTDQRWSGVWLSSKPLDVNEGTSGDVLLKSQPWHSLPRSSGEI